MTQIMIPHPTKADGGEVELTIETGGWVNPLDGADTGAVNENEGEYSILAEIWIDMPEIIARYDVPGKIEFFTRIKAMVDEAEAETTFAARSQKLFDLMKVSFVDGQLNKPMIPT